MKVCLLDAKRAQNLAIVLRQVPSLLLLESSPTKERPLQIGSMPPHPTTIMDERAGFDGLVLTKELIP
eukprot:2253737-Amphidinium_carterae.1